jgi:diguanylate cyclase (GGDEF)-like protein
MLPMQMPKLSMRIFSFLFESEELLQQKLADHRFFSATMYLMTAAVGTSHWIWDYITDPIGAKHTIGLRMIYLLLLAFPFAFKYIESRRTLEILSFMAGLLLLVNYVEILTRLNGGMLYGVGGFTFFLFLPLLIFQGFSVRMSLISTFVYAGVPPLLAVWGFAPGFDHPHYAVLIWPAATAMMLAHYANAQNYAIRYASEHALKLASNTDHLTGVSNRRHFVPLLRQEISRAQRFRHPFSLLILDIDFFKNINDTHGHPTGDVVICALADICRTTGRTVDIVARLGGEEFAILLLEVQQPEAMIVAERLRAAVERARVRSLDGVDFSFTVSIGVAEQPLGNLSAEKLLDMADDAMYQAKANGRNRVVAAKAASRTPSNAFAAEPNSV